MKLSCNEGETLVCVCGVIIAKSSLGCNTMSDVVGFQWQHYCLWNNRSRFKFCIQQGS